ncbi:carboxypeptidase regulatory-like domain-containing protein [Patescibacteria group bacterium]|nr:carboxypeptidase regulatory-like domain-containing protein [Patescibacteria group bacterium]
MPKAKNKIFFSVLTLLLVLSSVAVSHAVLLGDSVVVTPAATTKSISTSYTFEFTLANDNPLGAGEAGVFSLITHFNSGEPSASSEVNLSSAILGTVSGITGAGLVPPGPESQQNSVSVKYTNELSAGDDISLTFNGVTNPSVSGCHNLELEIGKLDNSGGFGGWSDRAGVANSFCVGNIVSGRVKDPDGNGVSFAGVELHTENYSTSYNTGTGEDGGFSFTDPEAGDYILDVRLNPDSGFVPPAEAPMVTVTGGIQNIGNIVVRAPSKTVSGTVKFADGTIPSNVEVGANLKGGRSWQSTFLGNSGAYELGLTGGDWELMLNVRRDQEGNQLEADWAYLNPPSSVSFADNETTETATASFTVIKATASVTGKVVYPDGTAVSQGGIDVRTSEGGGGGTGINDNGVFSVNLPAGKYKLGVHLDDQSYAAPETGAFTLNENEDKDLGTIMLVKKNEHIKGTVTGSGPIAGVEMEAWCRDGSGWAQATTGADGTYDLMVSPGTWEVMPRGGAGYVYMGGPPSQVTISADETKAGIDFSVTKADAAITGFVKDSDGNVMASLFGWAEAMEGTGDMPMPGPGGEVQNGTFTINVPAGTWTVTTHMPPGSEYSPAGSQTVTLASGETASVDITVKKNDAQIVGTVRDEDGNAITGLQIEVFGHSPSGGMKNAFIDKDTGQYTLNVVGGTAWFLGVFVPPNSGYMMRPPDDVKTTVASGETATKNFMLLVTDAAVQVTVQDPSGNVMDGVFAFADSNAGQEGGDVEFEKGGIHTGDLVSSDGRLTLDVPAGTYGVGSGAPGSIGYMNPDVQRVTVASGETKSVILRYKASDAVITGSVYLDGSKTQAFVWAWSDEGAHSETMTFSGDFSLNVTKGDTWHIGADYKAAGGSFYRSNEYVIALDASSASQDLTLSEADYTIPPALTRTFNANASTVIILENGATISIPAGALAQEGTVTVIATPTEQLVQQQNARPLAFGYDLEALASGTPITSTFSQDVTITLPYTVGMLSELGITEDQIRVSYFDATASLWQGITSFTVDTDNKEMIFTVDHFTEFAITTGSADTTPPSAPTAAVATAGDGEVALSWTNPTNADFDHVNIYRSTTSGSLGNLVTSTDSATQTAYIDSGLVNGATYYYTLRAVDSGGNESTNTDQTSVVPGAGLPATGIPFADAIAFYLQNLLVFLSPAALRKLFVR